MKSSEIREKFLQFFESKGHTRVPSSSLVPHDDPTLLFTNAGMNQFKDCFLGLDKRAYTRAVSSQKCVRAGGKHNDLENVGYTARHHTFFEMLGNFSFGDYFKKDAIHYAWEFLTSPAWLNIPQDKLTVTVYASDDEAYAIWQNEIGVPAERIIRIGDNKGAPYASDNFWAMGDTGPCGPCTEIFYDHGAHIWGGPPGSPEEDGDRFIEIWNNVFMQFNRTADGVLHPLPAPSVDTGMGLERISAVMQHVHANYEIDLFQSLLNAAAEAVGCKNEDQASLKVIADHIRSCSFLIADGVQPSNEGRGYVLRRIIRRACRHGNKLGATEPFFHKIVAALAKEMGDAYPQLKQLQAHIEKTLKQEEERFGETLENGIEHVENALTRTVFARRLIASELGYDIDDLGEEQRNIMVGYPLGQGVRVSLDLLLKNKEKVYGVRVYDLSEESEEKLLDRLSLNIQRLLEFRAKGMLQYGPDVFYAVFVSGDGLELPDSVKNMMMASDFPLDFKILSDAELEGYRVLSGKSVFTLYDTYGFPTDLTADICREKGIKIDLDRFEIEMDKQRERARAASSFDVDYNALIKVDSATEFTGYGATTGEGKVVALFKGAEVVEQLKEGEQGIVVLDKTPFYAESGGQAGDAGYLESNGLRCDVRDTTKAGGAHLHHVSVVQGVVKKGDAVQAHVDAGVRQATALNHSATHLMHAALRKVLGEHVAQKGSLVDSKKLRFDFSQPEPIKPEQLRQIEQLVNEQIRRNSAVETELADIETAKQKGAMMLFGEKYGDVVRVLSMGGHEEGAFSVELCGGTHVSRTGDIGAFKIVSESGVAAGVRRIEAVTGAGVMEAFDEAEVQLDEISALLKISRDGLINKIQQLLNTQRQQEKDITALKAKLASGSGSDLMSQVEEINGVKTLAVKLDVGDVETLRTTMDQLKNKIVSGVILLAGEEAGKVTLIAGVTKDLTGRFKAGDLVKLASEKVGGKGGGRPDMAQGGGADISAIPQALAVVKQYLSV